MLKTAESVSLGHPDKTADYISSYILDKLIEQDPLVQYAVEVMIKDNTVILAGEISTGQNQICFKDYVQQALCDIGYNHRYTKIWGKYALNINKLKVINLIGKQSQNIHQGIKNKGWGDQGVFVGYACQGIGHINRELYLAHLLNEALYQKALTSENLGLDIKTQITIDENGHIETAIVAIPMLHSEDLTDFISTTLGEIPKQLIINGTGIYHYHSSIADCGITGRKLACDFYSTASPIGGGSPWTKDPTKADLTLNIYARQLALQNLKDNDECFVYLSSCIGRAELPSGSIITLKNGIRTENQLWCNHNPKHIIKYLGLDKPIYTILCRQGLWRYMIA